MNGSHVPSCEVDRSGSDATHLTASSSSLGRFIKGDFFWRGMPECQPPSRDNTDHLCLGQALQDLLREADYQPCHVTV